MKKALALGALLLASAAPVAAAINIGDTIQITYLFPDVSTVYQVNSGVYTGTTLTLPIIYTGYASFDASSFTLTQTFDSYYSNAPFNGVKIEDLTDPNGFLGWVEAPGATGPNPHTTTLGSAIYVNWQGAPTTGQITFTAGVPEASTWAMLIAGFGLVGAAARRRKATAVTA
jgi:hypothetical protein